ncbi:Ribosomal protein L10 family protein [Forsythia ovata]|uniref:Ribosomal protein L10 family protein n=1 Tax=Forsythia ovata TaxID=205694 RepID=A0ABD1VKC9_9LAMI
MLICHAITLSKTKKQGREHKENVVNSIRDAIEKYDSAYAFTFENMRNLKFKEFREQLKSSIRFFLGSNKVMQVALGRSVADEIRPGLHKVSKLLRGDSGTYFTSLPKEDIQRLTFKWSILLTLKKGFEAKLVIDVNLRLLLRCIML